MTPNPTPVGELAMQLVEKLAKFEEVHFSSIEFGEDYSHHFFPTNNPPRFGNGIHEAIYRAVAAASHGVDPKLKVLILNSREPRHSTGKTG